MRVLVAGATGAVGRPLARALIAAGHEVSGLARSESARSRLVELGVQPVPADVYDPRLDDAVGAAFPDVVMHQLTALPHRIDPFRLDRDLAATNRLRTEGTTALLRAAKAVGARRFIAQGLAFAYAPAPGLADEDQPLYTSAPVAFRPMVDALVELERQVLAVGGVVLRYGNFYGPGTVYAPDGSMTEDARTGRLVLIGRGEGVMSFVHVDDVAIATVAAMIDVPRGVYNIVDDEPAMARDWLPELLGHAPWRVPRWLGRLAAGPYPDYLMNECRGASNARFKAACGWAPRHTWRGALGGK
jgi:nucleoside-diphosphate-sugar epimerase